MICPYGGPPASGGRNGAPATNVHDRMPAQKWIASPSVVVQ
jgi:hypothetical protein